MSIFKRSPLNNPLLAVEEILVPRAAVERMHGFLAEAGRAGYEGFTAWAGVQDGNTFYVKQTVIPRQTTHRTERGLYVLIESEELFALNRWLYENAMTLSEETPVVREEGSYWSGRMHGGKSRHSCSRVPFLARRT